MIATLYCHDLVVLMQKINKFFLRFSIPLKLTEFSLFNLRRINKFISAIVDKTELR